MHFDHKQAVYNKIFLINFHYYYTGLPEVNTCITYVSYRTKPLSYRKY